MPTLTATSVPESAWPLGQLDELIAWLNMYRITVVTPAWAPVDNLILKRWRALDAALVLSNVADCAKVDAAYTPVKNRKSSRWHATCCGADFELLLTGPKFWDTRAQVGGGGAVDLLMHLEKRTFKEAVARLVSLGL